MYNSVEDLMKAVDMYTQLYHKKCEELKDHKQMLGEMFEEMEWERNRRHELADRVSELEAEVGALYEFNAAAEDLIGLEHETAILLAHEVRDMCRRQHVCAHRAECENCNGCNYDDPMYIYEKARSECSEWQ